MHVAAPVYDPADGRTLIGVLSLAQPNRSIDPFIAASQRAIIERGAWLIGLSALVGVLVTMWLTTGLGQLSRYARAVSAGEPVPPPRRRRDEIGDLGQALETMRRKLEGKAYVEQYVQSLTHEMKSPLAAIRGAAELLQEPLPEADRMHFARSIVDQQERLTETIDKLLALAEVEQHGWLQTRDPIALPTLLADAAAAAQVRAQAVGVQVRIGSVPDLQVQGDGYLLRQALHNLIDNAIAFSGRRGDRAAGRGGRAGRAPAGGRPRCRHSRLCTRTGVRTLLFAGPPRQRTAQFRPGPAVRAGGRAPA